jgi:hypothetical protein
MLYINIALVDRANEKLKDFLAKVKPLTNALVSTYEELQKLQKWEKKNARKIKKRQNFSSGEFARKANDGKIMEQNGAD